MGVTVRLTGSRTEKQKSTETGSHNGDPPHHPFGEFCMSNDSNKPGTKTTIATVVDGPQFTIGGNLNVEDVMTVATSRAERKYATELNSAKKELKACESEEKAARKALSDAIKRLSETTTEA